MRRSIVVVVLLSGLLLVACGKYGKPTRNAPRDPAAQTRYTLPSA